MPPDPIQRFATLLAEATATSMVNPDALTLATADADGRPTTRSVLLKAVDDKGFVFYTNLESRKAKQLAANPSASMLFYWRELDRQVSVDGEVELVSAEEADAYFASRSRSSQLGAWASDQSRPLADRQQLLDRYAEFERKFEGQPVPRPPHWSGFRLKPRRIEFWKAGEHRLHEREVYERAEDGEWRVHLLNP